MSEFYYSSNDDKDQINDKLLVSIEFAFVSFIAKNTIRDS